MKDSSDQHVVLLFGIGIMVLGLVLLAGILRAFDVDGFLDKFWPLVIFFCGAIMLASKVGSAKLVGGGMMFVGLLLTLRKVSSFTGGISGTTISLLIAIAGLFMCIAAATHFSKK